MMLQTKQQGSRPCSFRKGDVFMFPFISLCKIYDPGAGSFLTTVHNLNKFGTDLLYDGTHQISRLYTLGL